MTDILQDFKAYMTITWQDETIDAKLTSMLERNKVVINALIGDEINYDDDLTARELLFNRARYDYNNALEYFEENYSSEILRIQLLKGVKFASAIENS